ncbi:MAG: creatininase family protein [Oscillospiraceae bacterium]|jgi:creatinine amidohydrolase|nr:creatininase family protein [Oscillospiraceae bacterium]
MRAINIAGRDWRERSKQAKYALLPLASFEYHGPIAPVGTDAAIVQSLAERFADADDCLLYPQVIYTACPAKTRRQPTISIEPDVMLGYLLGIMRGIQNAGITRLLVLNAHDGNMGIARAAAEAMEDGFQTLIVNWWQLISDEKTMFSDGGRGHGGPFELSAAWASLGWTDMLGDPAYDLPSYKFPAPHVLVEASPKGFDGYAGRVSEASGAKGEDILNRAAEELRRVIARWLAIEYG